MLFRSILNGFLETVYSVGTASGETVGDVLRNRFLQGEPLTEIWNNNSIYVSKLGDTGLYSVLIRPHVFTSDTTRSMYTVLLFMAAGSFLLSVGVAIGISSFLRCDGGAPEDFSESHGADGCRRGILRWTG